jgi:glycosyltransferase involved in cell wall biosynthesis
VKPSKAIEKELDYIQKSAEVEKPLVSVVVPAFNEASIIERNLARICDYLESLEHEYQWELVIVNDGSTDETGNLAETFASTRSNVHVLHHMYNYRLGQALRFAFSKSRGDYVVVMDIDLSYSPDHIDRMLSRIRETRAKVVVASPYMKGGKVSNVPRLRKVFSKWANRFLCLTATRDRFSDRLTTITGMVRAYDGKFLSHLNLKAMDVDIMPEIIYKAMILRARIVEVPAHLNWRYDATEGKQRKSSIRILRSILSSLLSGFMFRPFMFFVVPGIVLMILSLYPFFWIFIHTFNNLQNIPPSVQSYGSRLSGAIALAFQQSPHAFVVAGITLLLAVQMISLGFLALQSKRYFEELFHLSASMHTPNRNTEETR